MQQKRTNHTLLQDTLLKICKTFNKFYNENNIMNSEGELKKARLAVVMAVRDAIKKGLETIGLKAPEQM